MDVSGVRGRMAADYRGRDGREGTPKMGCLMNGAVGRSALSMGKIFPLAGMDREVFGPRASTLAYSGAAPRHFLRACGAGEFAWTQRPFPVDEPFGF